MVKIIGLLENTTNRSDLKNKHGLSLYIETPRHKILFDFGPDDLFLKNAETLGINVADVDTAVVSHGHVDHCGGLKYFLLKNKKAQIFIRPQAVEKHYVKVLGIPFYAGIDRSLVSDERFVFTGERHEIDGGLLLFSNDMSQFPLPTSDGKLFVKKNGKIVADDFIHEQNLIISEGDKRILVCGCAHSGIVNIVKKAKSILNEYPTDVVGGFHLYEPVSKRYEKDEYIERVSDALSECDADFYTCHCTGIRAHEKMKMRLGRSLEYIHTGSEIDL